MTREEAIEINKNLKEYMRILDKTSEHKFLEDNYIALEMAIKALEQEPKTGHWKAFTHSAYHGVDDDNEPIWREVKVYHCSECNRRTVIKENFCPTCGARMEVRNKW